MSPTRMACGIAAVVNGAATAPSTPTAIRPAGAERGELPQGAVGGAW